MFSCSKEDSVRNETFEKELLSLKALELSYKDQTFKALFRVSQGEGLRSVSVDGITEEACAQYAWYLQEKLDFDPEKNLKPYLLSQGLSDATVDILTSLKDYLNDKKLLSADDIAKLNVPYSDKKILVQVFSSLSIAIEYEGDGLRATRRDKVSDALDACWEDYLTDLGFYTAAGAATGSWGGGPIGFAIGGVVGVLTARYELYKCMKQAKRL